MTTQNVIDPWLLNPDGSVDPFAGTIDFGMTSKDEIDDPDLAPTPTLEPHSGLNPEVVVVEGGVPRKTAPVEAPVVGPDEPDQPEVVDLDDGGQIVLEKEKGQWKATLDPGNGANPEVFWGKNKNNLVTNVLKAKLNATKKIRELNKQVKLNGAPARTVSTPVPVQTTSTAHELTADERFEIQTQMQSDPDAAIEAWFEKKYGRTFSELVQRTDKGAAADANLRTEAVCRNFLAKNPDWYNDEESQNFIRLVQWLSKYKLGKVIPEGVDVTPFMFALDTNGWWTVESLEEAFVDLSDDGLLIKAPRLPKVPRVAETTPPVAVQNEPAPAQRPDERIVRTETRPRAALGIRPSDITPVAAPEAPTAPSVEDLENLPDAEVARLLGAIKRQRVQLRRSN